MIRIVRAHQNANTFDAVLEGERGEKLDRRCGVCDGELLVGDAVFVTLSRGVTHAISHRPDCVRALMREAGMLDARALVAEHASDEERRREVVSATREVLGKLDEQRLGRASR